VEKGFCENFHTRRFPTGHQTSIYKQLLPSPICSPPIPPAFNLSIIYSSEIPHIPPPLAIRDNLMRATSSLEIFLSFNGFEQIEKADNKEPN
jgi:hypothetical protein